MQRLKKLYPYFFPHPSTHQKAYLLHWHFLVIYILIFILLRVGFDVFALYKPGVLGIESKVTVEEIIIKTNQERQNNGLSPVKENTALDQAAYQKAKNMFAENYWAHYSPSGHNPWEFIKSTGYRFSYAGENLARNFYNADEVVRAWMNSLTHRENLLGDKYQDIGVAVVEGELQGVKTTLVVQIFATPLSEPIAINPQVKSIQIENQLNIGQSALDKNTFIIDYHLILRTFGLFILILIGGLLAIDYIVLKRRGVFRPTSSHLAHLSLITLSGAALIFNKAGEIL